MKQVCDAAIKLLESGESFVQATILESSGSVPRGTGSCMLILEGGGICDTVGGGAIEGGIVKAAPDVFREKKARVMNFLLDGNDAVAVGMICGGSATVLVDYISADDPGNLEFYKALRSVLRSGAQAYIATELPGKSARNQRLLMPDEIPAHGEGYIHRIGTDGTAYIFGAGHCGEKLVHVLAFVGFGTVIIDDREEFANVGRFPEADEIIVPQSLDTPLTDRTFCADCYIVIVTRGHAQDELVLRAALKTSAGYIGMIGSKRKREAIYDNLLKDGYSQSDINRVYSPIGVAIEAETPEEIAISIAGEMIRVRAERKANN